MPKKKEETWSKLKIMVIGKLHWGTFIPLQDIYLLNVLNFGYVKKYSFWFLILDNTNIHKKKLLDKQITKNT